MTTIWYIFKLLAIFQLKHFLADYPLQNEYMLGKFKSDWGFFKPLLAHCSVHAGFTFIIVLVANGEQKDVFWVALGLALIDGTIHFFMDRIKAGWKYLGRFKSLSKDEYADAKKESMRPTRTGGILPDWDKQDAQRKLRDNKLFWWSLGFDQMVHHLTDYFVILVMFIDKYGYLWGSLNG